MKEALIQITLLALAVTLPIALVVGIAELLIISGYEVGVDESFILSLLNFSD